MGRAEALVPRVLAFSGAVVAGLAAGMPAAAFGGTFDRAPLSFEPAADGEGWVARAGRYTVGLSGTHLALALPSEAPRGPAIVRSRWVGSNPAARATALETLPGTSNYFLGRDRRSWRTGVPHYARVRYSDIYPGIDVVYYGRGREVEYDLLVKPGADPECIRARYEGVQRLDIDSRGDLVLRTIGGDLHQKKPVAYQTDAGGRQEVATAYVLTGRYEVALAVGAYDRRRTLIIDPVLSYSSYLGGAGTDDGYAVALDDAGNIYVAGSTTSADFPTANAYQEGYRGTLCRFGTPSLRPCPDAFVTKLDPTGQTLLYSTYLGGGEWDEAFGLAVEPDGCAHLTGTTRSSDFPTLNPFQGDFGGATFNVVAGDAFVSKLDAAGGLAFSTYLGGPGDDAGYAVAADGSGTYVTGSTGSRASDGQPGFPLASPLQPQHGGGFDDAFVAKLLPGGGGLAYSTYLGGDHRDFGNGIAVDGAGAAYVAGLTGASDFPTTVAAFQPARRGTFDAFVSKLRPDGRGLAYSTYLGGAATQGGTASTEASGVDVDPLGQAYVTGRTNALDFPTTPLALQPRAAGGLCFGQGCRDAFVTTLDALGATLRYSTYLGGTGDDLGSGIAVDGFGQAHLTGWTESSDFPVKNAVQPTPGGATDAYVARLNVTGRRLLYSTYLGGSGSDLARGIAVCHAGAHVTGRTTSADFPSVAPFQPASGGGPDAFLASLDEPNRPR
jgi:beta-propeller repeat-containing protein